jgi:hypothetical protein
MRRVLVLICGILSALLAACGSDAAPQTPAEGASGAPPGSAAPPPQGSVVQVTAEGIYLDRGRLDGLTEGAPIIVFGRPGAESRLTIARISDHHAFAAFGADTVSNPAALPVGASRALAPGIERGASWTASSPPLPASILPAVGTVHRVPIPPTAPDPEAVVSGWKAALASPPPPRPSRSSSADHGGSAAGDRHAVRWMRLTPASLAYTHVAGNTDTYAGGLLTVRGLAAIRGDGAIRLDTDCDIAGWAARPDRNRLRPLGSGSLLLHRLALEYAGARNGMNVALGRSRPGIAFGAPLLDGGSVAWKQGAHGDGRSAGVYVGYLPDPLTLDPKADRFSIGAFGDAAGRRGSLRARLAWLRAGSRTREDGRLLLGWAGPRGATLEGMAAAARMAGIARITDMWIGIKERIGRSEIGVHHGETHPLLDPVEAIAYRDVLGSGLIDSWRSQRSEIRFSGPGFGTSRIEGAIGRSAGTGPFDRWTAGLWFAGPVHLGPVSRWQAGYVGSAGWQEGHEGDLGVGIGLGRWQADLSAGGGILHEKDADLTTFIGRGMIALRRPLGSAGSFSALLWGQGEPHSISAAGRVAFSYELSGQGSR